jgi:hypothetical protein
MPTLERPQSDGPVVTAQPSGLPSSIQSLTVPSSPPETMRVPSGENATLLIQRWCPLKGSGRWLAVERPQPDGSVTAAGNDASAAAAR